LIEHEFDRHARIGAREHRSERLLFLGGLSLQQLNIVLVTGPSAGNVSLVTFHEFF
jgi:hypothetical protein